MTPSAARSNSLVLFGLCAVVGTAYLIYLPHATPILDDWIYLSHFQQAWKGPASQQLDFVRHLMDNTWLAQFRIFWASVLPVFALSRLAGFAGWPYFLLAWIVHLLTAVLMAQTISIFSDRWTGFTAACLYAVFPAANNPRFWLVSTSFYYFQSLCLAAWLYRVTKRTLVDDDFRFRWPDLALLLVALFSGEQILAALLLLPPLTFVLFGRRVNWRRFLVFWLLQAAISAALLGPYVIWINRMPLARGFENRFGSGSLDLWTALRHLAGALGFHPVFAGWRAEWRLDLTLAALAVAAAIAFLAGARRSNGLPLARTAAAKLLLWSFAGLVLAYLPVARLNSFEWRYLYVPSLFLAPAVAAALSWMPQLLRTSLALLTILYALSQSYFETRQCWIPQSRIARGVVEAVTQAPPFAEHDVVIVSGAPIVRGVAADFITGASWSLQSMLEHYTRAGHIQGARDLAVNERGDLILHRRDSLVHFARSDLHHLRVFVRDAQDRFQPKPLLALPVTGDRFEIYPLRPFPAAALPAAPLTLDELKKRPDFDRIYFARRITSSMHSFQL